MTLKPRVSVVIPCYNQGVYIDDSVDAVLKQTFSDLEIIVVNDGSTDTATNTLLRSFERDKTRVLHTQNCGLGAARNNGIRAAIGEYILPLDADDLIAPAYIEKAVALLDSNAALGIVYCEADLFGDRTGPWKLAPYKFPEFLLGNVIFCSALFRRTDWETVGGFDVTLRVMEDFDFWLSIIELGREVHRIPEVLFHYRQHGDSTIAHMKIAQQAESFAKIMTRHSDLYQQNGVFIAERLMSFPHEIGAARDRIGKLEEEIATMQRSRFWKLRNRIVSVAATFRPKTD